MSDDTDTAGTIERNPSRPTTRLREAAKWLLWRVLPKSAYQRMLARAKSRDFQSGKFREPELDLIPLALGPGGTAVDVGANHGMWTSAFSRAAGPDGKVVAFEPVPFTFGTLEAVVGGQHLDNVELHNVGCSDVPGTFEMVVPAQSAGASDDLQSHLAGRGETGEDDTTVQCEIVRLDDVLERVASIDIFKIDVEGAELKALSGARETISRHLPVVVCEVDPSLLEGYGDSAAELERFMTDLGYRACCYEGEPAALESLGSLASIKHCNVVFLPPDAPASLEELVS